MVMNETATSCGDFIMRESIQYDSCQATASCDMSDGQCYSADGNNATCYTPNLEPTDDDFFLNGFLVSSAPLVTVAASGVMVAVGVAAGLMV